MNLCAYSIGVAAGIALSAAALAQSGIGPSLGTVEFRWRERSTPGYNGSYTIGPDTTPGVDAMPTPDPSAASVTAQDSSVVLVLEAKVTQGSGLAGNPIRGLFSAQFDVLTNQTSGGAFARQVVSDGVPGVNPRANARVNTTNLGFNPTTLLEHSSQSAPRTLVSPFRHLGSIAGAPNSPAVGHFRSGTNRIHEILGVLTTTNLDPLELEPTHPGQYDLAGLDSWVPLCIVIYTITDVTMPRDIVFSIANGISVGGNPVRNDYGLRTWRGLRNQLNGEDQWQLMPGFTTPPTFTVHVVPGPGAAGALGAGALLVMARRRR